MEVFKIPFGQYKDFKDCVKKNQDKKNPRAYCAEIHKKKNQDKKNPRAYCAEIHKKITGKWPSEMSAAELSARGLD